MHLIPAAIKKAINLDHHTSGQTRLTTLAQVSPPRPPVTKLAERVTREKRAAAEMKNSSRLHQFEELIKALARH